MQTREYNVRSPELDDDNIVVTSSEGEIKPKIKYHGCSICELPVVQEYARPNTAEAHAFLCLKNVDTIYQPQWGPVCGAASIAGTVLSLLSWHGYDASAYKDVVTVSCVQDIYHALGVPNVYETTAAVGNLTIKKACMMLRIPGLERAQLTVSDLTFLLAKDPAERAQAEWARLKRGMAEGARYLYHSRNHYNRVFGWRELYREPEAPSSTAPTPAAPGGSEQGQTSPSAAQTGSGITDTEDNKENAGTESGTQEQSENAGPPLASQNLRAAPSSGIRKTSTLANKRALELRKATGRTAGGTASTAASLEHLQPASMQPYLVSRQILMAKKGQRPQHWVEWEAVQADVAQHKLHTIFEIKMVHR